jgi:Leucine-rich repeat (LRR) protein
MILLGACTDAPTDTPSPTGSETVKVTGISVGKTTLTLSAGSSETLTFNVVPADASNRSVTWTSSLPTVVSVDASGRVTAVKKGEAVITAKTADQGYTATCTITVASVAVPVSSVTLNLTTLALDAESSQTLTARVAPAGATNKTIRWSSSDISVATVNAGGVVTGIKAGGKAVITATSDDGTKSADCTVTVGAIDPNNLLRSTYIPDPVFIEYCRKQLSAWDTNDDGKLYAAEAAAVTSIDVANVNGNAIGSLRGIEYFTGITYLDCSLNNLTSLDVSRCTRLAELYCNNNPRLSALEVSPELTILNCSACSLTQLDVSRCNRLVDLTCYYNELAVLDVSNCTLLNYLDVDNNNLTRLDVSRNRALKGLICDNNSISALDVSTCTSLTSLDCKKNRLTRLDVSRNKALINLSCDMNDLTALDVSGNAMIESLICNGNEISSIVIGGENERLKYIQSSNNDMSSGALNAVFSVLPNTGTITIYNNPGTATCDKTIATSKNWIVMAEQ